MSDQDRPLGGRLPLLQPAEMSAAQMDVYDRIRRDIIPWAETSGFESMSRDGALIWPFNSQLYSPDIDACYLDLVQAEQRHSSLSKRVREIVILAVGTAWKADYEIYAHEAAGRTVGLSEAVIRDAVSGHASNELAEDEAIAYRFAWQLSQERRIDDKLYADAERVFGRRGLADMSYLIGIYHLVCGFLNAFDVPTPAG